MKIGGFQETSLLDYPGKIATIIWTTGCNFRCPFCYNRDLVLDQTELIPVDVIFSFLDERNGKIDAVSISGGEPFLQKDLYDFVSTIKHKGFLVKIDTNGSFPKKLEQMIDDGLIDYVSMDVKAPKSSYEKVTNTSVNIENIDSSIHIIRKKAPDYEFKTTVIPRFHKEEDIIRIAQWIKGSKKYYLQQFKHESTLLSEIFKQEKSYTKEELEMMCQKINPFFDTCKVRGI
jgi:pyruvate formate lyase activating enzyme